MSHHLIQPYLDWLEKNICTRTKMKILKYLNDGVYNKGPLSNTIKRIHALMSTLMHCQEYLSHLLIFLI
jgi:hypothetical protein